MSEIRLTYTLAQPVVAGYSSVRINLTYVQPLTAGYSTVRVNDFVPQPLTGGYSKIRLTEIIVQALYPVPEDPKVSTIPFPGFGNSAITPSLPAAKDPFNSSLPGLTFSVHKKPMFKTRISEGAAGNEVRNAMMQYPRWDFELTYDYLEDKSGANSSLKTIMGFFLARQGSFDSWLFKDPDDYQVTAGICGTSDGVTTAFPFARAMGGFIEKVGQVDTANTINVYLDGALQSPSLYTVTLPNTMVFTTAPAAGTITATFQFFYACRFVEDQMDFEKFYDKLWSLQTCDFRSIIQ